MKQTFFPTIDLEATGKNIIRLRKQKGLTVKDLQNWFGFEEPRAIYKWQTGQSLPSIDNLYAYLMGRGKPGLEGSKLVKAQEDGAKQLAHILAEADIFAEKIAPSIGADALGKLRAARNKWLTARARAASKDDLPFWQRLQKVAKAQ